MSANDKKHSEDYGCGCLVVLLIVALISVLGPNRPGDSSLPTATSVPVQRFVTLMPTRPIATLAPVRPTATPVPLRVLPGKPTPQEEGSTIDQGYTCNRCIKGNISIKTRERIYHLPDCPYYEETRINTAYGERWFSSEAEAIRAGWRKAKNCPSASTPKQ